MCKQVSYCLIVLVLNMYWFIATSGIPDTHPTQPCIPLVILVWWCVLLTSGSGKGEVWGEGDLTCHAFRCKRVYLASCDGIKWYYFVGSKKISPCESRLLESLPFPPLLVLHSFYTQNDYHCLLLSIVAQESVANEHKGRVPKSQSNVEEPTVVVGSPPDSSKSGVPCPVLLSCAANEFSYFVQSGQGPDKGPVVCYNNELWV